MASGWNLWVWVPCLGVVSGCCKEVYRCFPYSTCISSFFVSSIPTFLFILKCFFGLISRDERGFPLTQYITNGRISRAMYTISHFKHRHRVLRLISNRISV